jgi:hypothetical protein
MPSASATISGRRKELEKITEEFWRGKKPSKLKKRKRSSVGKRVQPEQGIHEAVENRLGLISIPKGM